jgi:hypothetical protein
MSGDEIKSKRSRKPKVPYAPEDYTVAKRPHANKVMSGKNRNQAVSGAINKWLIYKSMIKRAVELIAKEEHFMEVRIQSSHTQQVDKESKKSAEKIYQAKKAMLATFKAMSEESAAHKVWSELAQGDEEGMVDLNGIYCSKCNKEDWEGHINFAVETFPSI